MPDDWRLLFSEAQPELGASADHIRQITPWLFAPLSAAEIAHLRESLAVAPGEAGDPTMWSIPSAALPPSYLAFLTYSDGGFFLTGEREFNFLKSVELREYLLVYEFPRVFAGAVPFALNGVGSFYVFDLRSPPDAAGEVPILLVSPGDFRPEAAVLVAPTFPDALRGTDDPQRFLDQP